MSIENDFNVFDVYVSESNRIDELRRVLEEGTDSNDQVWFIRMKMVRLN